MHTSVFRHSIAALTVALITALPTHPRAADAPLALESARITIAGTSNVHAWTARSTHVRVTRMVLSPSAGVADSWSGILAPGGVQAFDVAVAAKTLESDKDGLNKNMYKALKVDEHPDIVFRLARLEGANGIERAAGRLEIAGVERDVTLPLAVNVSGAVLTVKGSLDLLMTDYGIAPPKAMLGMLKTDPKVTVAFEIVLGMH